MRRGASTTRPRWFENRRQHGRYGNFQVDNVCAEDGLIPTVYGLYDETKAWRAAWRYLPKTKHVFPLLEELTDQGESGGSWLRTGS